MNKLLLKSLLSLCLGTAFLGHSQNVKKVSYTKNEISKATANFFGTPQIQATEYKVFQIDVATLKSQLNGIAFREHDNSGFVAQLEFPHPDGTMHTYNAKANETMHPELAAKFPEIKSYDAVNVETGTAVKWDITPQGLHAMIFQNEGSTIFIDPLIKGNTDYYIVYYKSDFYTDKKMECSFNSGIEALENPNSPTSGEVKSFGTCELRTYRLALAATVEYTAFHGGLTNAQAAQVTTMNRVNGIYERDMAITMNLVANNNLIVFSGSDSYTNGNAGAMIGQNQTIVDNAIGNSNYDIGHVFGTNSGGLAGLGVVCSNGSKANGVTGSGSPIGDTFDVDYVAHEMGHQFGCNHTFNNSCSGNRNNSTAMEPGSGSTIMAYAGICSPNVQNFSDDYFHGISLQEMGSEILSGGHTCEVITPLSNSAPSITSTNGGATVPAGTPFVLTAVASDANGDPITYDWEQMNNQISTQAPVATSTGGPNFRSLDPSTSPSRYFPKLGSTNFTWERLPTVSRTMNFRVTVRDNAVGGGCNDHEDISLTVDGGSGPFVVLYPSTSGITWTGATTETVTWDVANTSGAPVNCSNVDILLSTNGGSSFPTVLASNVPNDGSHDVLVPNIGTTVARIMVISSTGTFYDVSDMNFKITVSAAGLNDITEINNISIYPNPAAEIVTVSWKGELTSIRLTDSKGKVLKVVDYPMGESFQLDVANYTTGIYYVQVESQYGSSVYNLVKQ
jgi:hypothetical protein